MDSRTNDILLSRQTREIIKICLLRREHSLWHLNISFLMRKKRKFLIEYLNEARGFRELCRICGMSQGALRGWICLYNVFGFESLVTGSKTTHYSSESMAATVRDYLSGKLTGLEVLKDIKSGQKMDCEI